MTRDDLEAAIWQAMTRHRIRGPHPAAFVTDVLRAADRHAVYIGGITADRRAQIAAARATRTRDQRATSARVHRRDPHYSTRTLCGLAAVTRLVTHDNDAVTCQRCNPWLKETAA